MRPLLVVFLVAAQAHADGQLAQIAARKVLRVGMVPGLAPFVAAGPGVAELERYLVGKAEAPVRSSDGREVAGFDVELAGEAAGALGVRLEIVLEPSIDALLDAVRSGRVDVAISSITRTLERARTVAFSDPYFSSGLLVLVRDAARFPTLESLRAPSVTVAFRAGTTAADFAARELLGARLRPVDSDAAILSQLDAPPAPDALVIDQLSARDAEVRGNLRKSLAAVEERRFTSEQFAFAVRQGDPDWLAWLNLFLKELKSSGAFHRRAARYNAWFRAER
jgi:polar amino acid transport system substrate-binding protein